LTFLSADGKLMTLGTLERVLSVIEILLARPEPAIFKNVSPIQIW
jgi:hypothetical protein